MPASWSLVDDLFQAALACEVEARPAFLAGACAGDAELRTEVESLLEADACAGGFLETAVLRPQQPAVLERGRRLGPYVVLDALGHGGMGHVYRARDTRLGREVALKVLPRSFAAGPALRARFRIEGRALSALHHPNVVCIYDMGEDNGIPYLAMELVRGHTLGELQQQGRLPLHAVLTIAVQVADGLAGVHAGGVVHRDIKPDNVIVTAEGVAKVVDFGIAKPPATTAAATQVTLPGTLLGTVGYMSPEQASGREADFRSDHFSFGIVLYEMVTGRPAFRRATDVETLAAIIREEPEAAGRDLPRPLTRILSRCLAKDPHERYRSSLDLAHDLRHLRDCLFRRSTPAARRARRPAFSALTLAATALVSASVFFTAARWARSR